MKKICLWVAIAALAAAGCSTDNSDNTATPTPHPAMNAQPSGMPTSPANPSPNGAPVP